VRRLLGLAASALPGLTRVDLVTNYRCPAPVLEGSVRLIEQNDERFAKVIRARDDAPGSLVLAPSAGDDLDRITDVLASFPAPTAGATFAVLARTNRELIPAAIAAVRLGIPFRAKELKLPIEADAIDGLLDRALGLEVASPVVALGRVRRDADWTERRTAEALLGWSVPHRTVESLVAAIAQMRAAVTALRRDDAALTLATAHGTKGLEFDHVAVIGLDAGRFPSARSIAEAVEPERALEEERRLAYVAWTRARRSLTLLYDPGAPSRFLLEAFSPAELGSEIGGAAVAST
jgi:superfamily I DNA/RNA helicase